MERPEEVIIDDYENNNLPDFRQIMLKKLQQTIKEQSPPKEGEEEINTD